MIRPLCRCYHLYECFNSPWTFSFVNICVTFLTFLIPCFILLFIYKSPLLSFDIFKRWRQFLECYQWLCIHCHKALVRHIVLQLCCRKTLFFTSNFSTQIAFQLVILFFNKQQQGKVYKFHNGCFQLNIMSDENKVW